MKREVRKQREIKKKKGRKRKEKEVLYKVQKNDNNDVNYERKTSSKYQHIYPAGAVPYIMVLILILETYNTKRKQKSKQRKSSKEEKNA